MGVTIEKLDASALEHLRMVEEAKVVGTSQGGDEQRLRNIG
jgi:hypothetical protein